MTPDISEFSETTVRVRYVETDQMGESRLDRNVKRFFVSVHRTEDPTHVLTSNY